jgi:hypothetical protein
MMSKRGLRERDPQSGQGRKTPMDGGAITGPDGELPIDSEECMVRF